MTFRFLLSTLFLSKRGELIDFVSFNGIFLLFNFFKIKIGLVLFSFMVVSLGEKKTAEPIRALARLRKSTTFVLKGVMNIAASRGP